MDQIFGCVYSDGMYSVFVKVLGYFKNQLFVVVVGGQCVEDSWQIIFELYVDNGVNYLCDFVFCVCYVLLFWFLECFSV